MGILDKFKNIFGSGGQSATQNAVSNQLFDALISKLFKQANATGENWYSIQVSKLESYNEIQKLSETDKIDFFKYCIAEKHKLNGSNNATYFRQQVFLEIMKSLMKSKTVYSDDDVAELITLFIKSTEKNFCAFHHWPVLQLLTKVVKQREENPAPLSASINSALENLRRNTESDRYDSKEILKITNKINELQFVSKNEKGTAKRVLFLGEDDFRDYANSQITEAPEADKAHWYQIIAHAQRATGGKPTVKYLSDAKKLIEALGVDKFRITVAKWFLFATNTKDDLRVDFSHLAISSINSDALKGLVWMSSESADSPVISAIASLAQRCLTKVQYFGQPYVALGNSCLYALYKSEGLEGIGHLSRLKLRIKQSNTLKIIEGYLENAATESGMSVYEIEDLSVPDYGFVSGVRAWHFKEYKAEVCISGIGKTETKWIKPDGNLQKTAPVFVKDDFAEEFKELKATIKQAEATLSSQRDRIDRMLRSNREMTWAHFKKHYLQHGILSYLAKKIIWNFSENGKVISAISIEDEWKTNENTTVIPSESTTVSLWHPAVSPISQITGWRDFLIDNRIQQPFKQAFREVYLLTEAELNTKSYSNRMAAHVLKQHQFNMLAKTRGWKYSLLGCFDDGRESGTAEITLSEYGLRAEYWVNEINADNEMNDTGIWNYVATDQVRFCNSADHTIVDLIDVPPIPFSEIMRDVDLFVGVASVGNDPAWQDTGGIPAYRDYWQSYSFGDLSELAKMRKEILSSLVPRLKISKVAEIKDKFLVVKGKLRTYKIHIGSTNILMEPNDQYLCIVPNRSEKDYTENVFLPFEGDKGLSVVLSKAFLLADDDKITDSTITSQINRK